MENNPEHHERDLFLCDQITEYSVKDIVKDIFEINADDAQKEKIYKNWERLPIRLFINSYGGSIYDGLALVDIIKTSETPIHTISVGACMSMALWVWLVGEKRLVGESSTLMFHDLSAFASGESERIKQKLEEMLRLQEKLIREITGKSVIPEEKLRDFITRKAEWYIPAEEAIALKLADQYYE